MAIDLIGLTELMIIRISNWFWPPRFKPGKVVANPVVVGIDSAVAKRLRLNQMSKLEFDYRRRHDDQLTEDHPTRELCFRLYRRH